uniref:Diguanylate cyclase n=1 Tax=Macrostomum lignano TaxID=282301 RepID=A0A1I8J8Z2_9PLAT
MPAGPGVHGPGGQGRVGRPAAHVAGQARSGQNRLSGVCRGAQEVNYEHC